MKLSALTRHPLPGSARTPLTALDWALAQFCHSLQASDDERHRWLAALASHQWGRGHACLDTSGWPQRAAEQLAWSPEQLQALPSDLIDGLHSLPWTQGENSPLVFPPPAAAALNGPGTTAKGDVFGSRLQVDF